MSLTIAHGGRIQIINDRSISYNQLLKTITDVFGIIGDVEHKIAYDHHKRVTFIVDDHTFSLAKRIYPIDLRIYIQEDEIQDNGSSILVPQRCYSAMNGIDLEWNENDWVDNILKAKPFSYAMNSPPCQVVHQQICQDTIRQIQSHNPRTQRFCHSEDLIGSFLMSCFHLDARSKVRNNQEIDKAIWNLDRWRNQKRKESFRDNKDNKIKTPILQMKSQKMINLPKRNSYFYQRLDPSKAVIQEPGQNDFQDPLTLESLPTEQEKKEFNHVKYYLIDQVYHHLTQYAEGKIQKSALQNLVSIFRKFTDEDMNFVVKVFEAYIEYSKTGDIYLPAVITARSGMLPQFNDDEIVGILGDWGTGQMDAMDLLDQLVFNQNASIILHLGDVYYAGFPDQFERISNKIKQLQGKRPNLRYYTVPGNHDYYTFGGPFHEHLKKNHVNKIYNQQFGFFCLRNRSQTVQFIGLNTGKNEHGMTNPIDFLFQGTFLEKDEAIWAINRINQFAGKSILLTHHQMFSPFQGILGSLSKTGSKTPQINDKLTNQLFEILPKLTCWFWGHEHRFSTFIANSFGVNRCILAGNSSFQNNEEDYYENKYPCDGIVQTKYHPAKGEIGYYDHTGIVMNDFLAPSIKMKYIYMTSSFDQPSKKVRQQFDTLSKPIQVKIQYKKTYQLIEQSGLSLSLNSNSICLDTSPANLQFINPKNTKSNADVEINTDVLIRIENTMNYLYYSFWGFVEYGDYENQYKMQKNKYLWRIIRKGNGPLRTGDIFYLINASKGYGMARQNILGQQPRLSESETPSKFYLYIRETTHLPPLTQLKPNNCCCCDIM